MSMEFALFYEIPVPQPVDAGQRAPGVQEHDRAGGARRAGWASTLVLDRGAPLPRGVLALLQPRGALRRDRGAHREHPHRLRRAPAAQAVQPPDPHRGVGRGARPHLRRPASSSAPAARRPAPSSRASASTRTRPARSGRRRSGTSSARGPRTSTRPTASTGRCRRAACHPKPLQQPHPPICGSRRPAPTATCIAGELGLGLLLVHRRRPARGARRAASTMYREGLAACTQPDRASSSTHAPRRSRWCTARRPTRRLTEARGVVRVVRAHRRSGTSGPVAEWQEGKPTSAPTSTPRDAAEGAATVTAAHVRLPASIRARAWSATRSGASRSATRYDAADCDLLLCLLNPYKIPHETVMRSIELLGEHVIPELRRLTPPAGRNVTGVPQVGFPDGSSPPAP